MATNQPVWKFVQNLGDVHPIEYGGYFVFSDETGVYPPEAEKLIEPTENQDLDDPGARWIVYRYCLERCTFEGGVLSDNQYHKNLGAWFADSIASIASYIGQTELDLINSLCSENPIDRAFAYQAIGDYHGFENLDSYPLTLTRSEVETRYKDLDI